MHPVIRDGEAVLVRPVAAARIRRGDILLYELESRPLLHRVAGVGRAVDGSRKFILRSDAAATEQDVVGIDRILGRVAGVERGGRTVGLTGGGSRLVQMGRLLARRGRRFSSRLLRKALNRLL